MIYEHRETGLQVVVRLREQKEPRYYNGLPEPVEVVLSQEFVTDAGQIVIPVGPDHTELGSQIEVQTERERLTLYRVK